MPFLRVRESAISEAPLFLLFGQNPYLDSNVYVLKEGRIEDFGRAKDIITVDNLVKVYGDNICYSDELSYREISFKDVTHV